MSRERRGWLVAVAVALGLLVWLPVDSPVASSPHATAAAHAHLVQVGSFDNPDFVASTPVDPQAIYVVERPGRVWIIRRGHRRPRPFLDISGDVRVRVGSEQGMWSLAFAPDYARSGLYYVAYSNRDGNTRVRQFRRSPTNRDRTLPHGRTILAIPHHSISHYGGQLAFGPDHYLYISTGDGGCCNDPHNYAQRKRILNGKILRIAPLPPGRHRRYSIPRGNPFSHGRHGRREVFAYGLRNPFRFSFDASGAIWIADVGEDHYEEVDYRRAGRLVGTNFGWSHYEGFSFHSSVPAPHAVPPVLVESHSDGWCAIIGGYVVRDRSLGDLVGRYLFGDWCSGRIASTRAYAHRRRFPSGSTGLTVPGGLTSFGVGASGRVYVTGRTGGVYRLAG